jgi:spermidine synthase
MPGLFVLVFIAGAAGLSWEVLWQLEASLAIGVSAKGTAITLATTMGGMAIGAALMGWTLRGREVLRPMRVYAACEAVVGLSGGLLLLPGLRLVAHLDASTFAAHPALASVVQIAGMACVLGPSAIAMGATIPVLGLAARDTGTSLPSLYAINTAGACAGVLFASFVLLPYLGVEVSAIATACVNLSVAAAAFISRRERVPAAVVVSDAHRGALPPRALWLVVIASGFLTFALEVTWFRALRAAFLATTHSFAVMLAAVLLALAGGARLATWAQRRGASLGATLAAAGIAVLVATPILERFDTLAVATAPIGPTLRPVVWFLATVAVVGPGVVLLGASLPWVLGQYVDPHRWGRAYALNTIAAVAGSLAAGWLLLPAFGFSGTAWVLGGAAVACAMVLLERRRTRRIVLGTTYVALALAFVAESGLGSARVMTNIHGNVQRVLAFEEGPDSTVAVAEVADGTRVLLIDGFAASAGAGAGSHYMVWMGRLPMILHPAPKRALVICFGTGQTANAVRRENPESLEIVDLDAAVYKMAAYFPANEGVLDDPRVRAIVMDGRAWMRRTDHRYDVITLEPMPPNFAGVNSLYSQEFYELAAQHLEPGGIIAQWLPIHILSVHDAIAIAATFRDVFPDSLLWLDPLGATGILVGRRGDVRGFGADWPGLERTGIDRDLSPEMVRSRIVLGPRGVTEYARPGEIVTDDNQLLSYGPRRYRFFGGQAARLDEENLLMMKLAQVNAGPEPVLRRAPSVAPPVLP